jgi:transcriptional regulator with XRE-family HTH domain
MADRKTTAVSNEDAAQSRDMGLKIRRARIEAGMSQTALGDSIGVSFQQIQKYEKGVNRVSMPALIRVAAAVDKPITHFVGAANGPMSDTDLDREVFLSSATAVRLVAAAQKLQPRALRAIVELMETM